MPSGPARRTAGRVALALLALLLLALVWLYLAPAYDRVLVALAGPISPSTVDLGTQGLRITLSYRPLETGQPPSTRIHGLTLHAGILLLSSLILATPRCSWRTRAGGLAVAWLAFLVLNAGSVALLAWGLAWTMEGGPLTLSNLASMLPLAYVGLPALAGAGWCLRLWAPALGFLPARGVGRTRQKR